MEIVSTASILEYALLSRHWTSIHEHSELLLPFCLLQKMHWQIGSEKKDLSEDGKAQYWIPDADIHEQLITVDTMPDIMAHLRGMPEVEINRKLKEMQSERLRFTFQVPHLALQT